MKICCQKKLGRSKWSRLALGVFHYPISFQDSSALRTLERVLLIGESEISATERVQVHSAFLNLR